MKRAVVDVGSNSVLLVLAEWNGSGWRTVKETSQVTGLGTGMKQSGRLAPEAMDRTLAALRRALADAEGTPVEFAGTMALRVAENAPEFLAMAKAQGTPVRVLSGEQEAELGFESVAGDAPLVEGIDRLSIVDPGGQSTELVTAQRDGQTWRVLFRQSYPVGTLALRAGVLASEAPTGMDLLRAAKQVDEVLGMRYRPGACGRVVGLGASATNLVTLREQMTGWEPERVHGVRLGYEEISRFVESLSPHGDRGRAGLVGLEPGREGTIHIGALILERFLYSLGAEELTVSVRGWRHALLERG